MESARQLGRTVEPPLFLTAVQVPPSRADEQGLGTTIPYWMTPSL